METYAKKKLLIGYFILASLWMTQVFADSPVKNHISYTHPIVAQAVRHDISKPLAQIAKEYNENNKQNILNSPKLFPLFPVPLPKQTLWQQNKDNALQTHLSVPLDVVIGLSFKGFGVSRGDNPTGAPSDTTGAAGLLQLGHLIGVLM